MVLADKEEVVVVVVAKEEEDRPTLAAGANRRFRWNRLAVGSESGRNAAASTATTIVNSESKTTVEGRLCCASSLGAGLALEDIGSIQQ